MDQVAEKKGVCVSTFKDLGEFGFIDRIARHGLVREEGVLCGIGDDCAVFELEEERALLVTADLMVEEVHFRVAGTALEGLGYKLLAVNLSDVAAMGGEPRDAVVSAAIPADFDAEYMERVYNGLHTCASRFGVNVAGGDTTRSPGPLVLNLTLTGEMARDRVRYRSGARPGDLVYVSGTLGDSAAGLKLALGEDVGISEEDRAFLLRRHHRPEPRVALGQALAATGAVTAMIDLSDGAASDLRHVCRQSGVGAVVAADAVPLSPALRAFCEATQTDPLCPALSGGEDYELLFTVDPERVRALKAWEALPAICPVGRIEAGEARIFLEGVEGGRKVLEGAGFDHFKAGCGEL